MKGADFFFPVLIEQDPKQMSKMLEILSSGVRGFRRDPVIIQERRVNPAYGAIDAYEHLAPIIDTDVCMEFLKNIVTAKGAKLVTQTIHGDLFDQEASLRADFSADVIINCTGLAASETAGDPTCYPLRGGLLRVINDGTDFPKVNHALTITADAVQSTNEIVFLVPRNDNILLIGGIAQPHMNTLDLTLHSPVIKRMRARCEAFLPDLKNARLDDEYPLAQGLRPVRPRNVRVERELRFHSEASTSRIVHCYGQGGSGWSLSFGCASDVLALVEEALLDVPARPMMMDETPTSVSQREVFKAVRAHL
jgi:glycine/D-amino acid oxidase-like deaminating enzyme